MPLTRERKEELVAEYIDLLERSKAVILTEYRGLSNKEMSTLRNLVREAGGIYRVAKLTLFKRALEASGYTIPNNLAGVPLAIGFCLDDIPGVAKAITNYAKDSEFMSVRGGLMRDQMLSIEQVQALAELPPLEVLHAQLLGLLDAPAANLVGVIQAGVAQVVNVIHAYLEDRGVGATADASAG